MLVWYLFLALYLQKQFKTEIMRIFDLELILSNPIWILVALPFIAFLLVVVSDEIKKVVNNLKNK